MLTHDFAGGRCSCGTTLNRYSTGRNNSINAYTAMTTVMSAQRVEEPARHAWLWQRARGSHDMSAPGTFDARPREA